MVNVAIFDCCDCSEMLSWLAQCAWWPWYLAPQFEALAPKKSPQKSQ